VIRDWDHENEPTFFDVLTDAAASNNVATPVFAPLNTEDGRADLVIPLQQTTTTLNQNPAAIYLEARPTGTPHGSPPPTEGPYFNPGFIDQPDNPAETARRVYLSLVPGYAPNFPGANGLEVAVWRQANESALLPLTPEYFKIHALADLPSQEGNVGLGVDVMIPNDCFVVGTDSYLLWATITPVYFEGTYPATVDPQTPRPYIGGMTTDENVFCSFVCLNDPTVGIQSMVGNTAPSGWPNLGMDSCGEVDCEQPQNGSWQAPPIAPRRRMPQFQPGTFPTESTVHQVATQNMATINY
jgi:hypothetical protein